MGIPDQPTPEPVVPAAREPVPVTPPQTPLSRGAGANIAGAEVIHGFRRQLAEGVQAAVSTLESVPTTVERVAEWIRHEQIPAAKRRIVRLEEACETARLAWLAAEGEVRNPVHTRGGGRQSSDEERVNLVKAKRRRDEAVDQLAQMERWVTRLEGEGRDLAGRVRNHNLDLEALGQRAVNRLDHMAESLEAYFQI